MHFGLLLEIMECAILQKIYFHRQGDGAFLMFSIRTSERG